MKLRTVAKLGTRDGQMLPFISILLIILVLLTATHFSLTFIYLQRTKIRDAVDAAALAGASTGEIKSEPTYYGEEYVGKRWRPVEYNYQNYILIDEAEAKKVAEHYFYKNVWLSGIENMKIISLDVKVKQNDRWLQVHKHRPNTEGVITSWEQNFPDKVDVSVTARVSLPIPLGNVIGRDTLNVSIRGQATKRLK